jgi:hypothetical protein
MYFTYSLRKVIYWILKDCWMWVATKSS